MKKSNFNFNYKVTSVKDNEILHIGSVSVELTADDIKRVGEQMQANGGIPVDLCEVTWLDERVSEAAIMEFASICSDDVDWDDTTTEVSNRLPQELVSAAGQYVTLKFVDCHYYYMLNEAEQVGTCRMSITPEVFDQMVEVLSKQAALPGTDFDKLQAANPEAYAHSGAWALEYAYKEGITRHNCDIHAYLKEFPLQVYDCVEL